jgi:hypothetical protein
MADKSRETPENPPQQPEWSIREQEWITGLAEGLPFAEIADRTQVEYRTVKRFSLRPDVIQVVSDIRSERWERATNLATSYHGAAIEVTHGLLTSEDENIQLNAARLMHRMSCDLQELNLSKRLEEVEKSLREMKGE